MKNSPLTTVLLAMLLLSALTSVVLCWSYINHLREMRFLQGQVNSINYTKQMVPALINDASKYAEHSPAMERALGSVMEPFGYKLSKTNSANSARPPAK